MALIKLTMLNVLCEDRRKMLEDNIAKKCLKNPRFMNATMHAT